MPVFHALLRLSIASSMRRIRVNSDGLDDDTLSVMQLSGLSNLSLVWLFYMLEVDVATPVTAPSACISSSGVRSTPRFLPPK